MNKHLEHTQSPYKKGNDNQFNNQFQKKILRLSQNAYFFVCFLLKITAPPTCTRGANITDTTIWITIDRQSWTAASLSMHQCSNQSTPYHHNRCLILTPCYVPHRANLFFHMQATFHHLHSNKPPNRWQLFIHPSHAQCTQYSSNHHPNHFLYRQRSAALTQTHVRRHLSVLTSRPKM